MSRRTFDVDLGFGLLDENGTSPIQIIRGSGAPGSTTATDNALQGSLYLRENGESYLKYLSGTGTDKWIRQASLNDITALNWRSDKVVAATGDAAPVSGSVINLVTNPFGDDEGTTLTAADFPVGTFVLFGVGGTPKLMEVTVSSAPNITVEDATDALADNDMMIVSNYLPDSPDNQEKQAIVQYNGSAIIKIADFNWELATGINLSGSYSPASGDITNADTVESAIEKLDGNNDAQDTLLGTAQGSTDLGTFPGDIISDNTTVKNALSELETEVIRLDGQSSANAVTTAVVLDEVNVDDFLACEWELTASLDSNPATRIAQKVFAVHNGHSGADATIVDDTVYAKIKTGNVSITVTIELSGTGAAQKFQLKVAAAAATSFRAKRVGCVEANGI